MPDFNARPDSVNVEHIMEQIRSRIREKRGVDYEAQQIEELARAKVEKLLDPHAVQTDLLDRLKRMQPTYEAPQLPTYEFEDSTLYDSTRAPLRFIRRLLNPILKLFFNPNPLIAALHTQTRLNALYAEREAKRDATRLAGEQLYYQMLHNLLIEITQAGMELKTLRMRVESMGSRLEFNERRARAIESAVAYPPSAPPPPDRSNRGAPPPATPQPLPSPTSATQVSTPTPPTASGQPSGQPAETSGQRSRRRRRRRGRRGGAPQSETPMGSSGAPESTATDASEDGPETSAADDLENFSGAAAHPSEPIAGHDHAEPESSAPPADATSDADADKPQ